MSDVDSVREPEPSEAVAADEHAVAEDEEPGCDMKVARAQLVSDLIDAANTFNGMVLIFLGKSLSFVTAI